MITFWLCVAAALLALLASDRIAKAAGFIAGFLGNLVLIVGLAVLRSMRRRSA